MDKFSYEKKSKKPSKIKVTNQFLRQSIVEHMPISIIN